MPRIGRLAIPFIPIMRPVADITANRFLSTTTASVITCAIPHGGKTNTKCRLYAFGSLTNHSHFIVIPGDAPESPAKLMKRIAGRQARLSLNGHELAKASRFGHLELVKALLRRGADVNARDEKGNTPWSNAVEWGHEDVARYLAAHGADTTSGYEP